MVASKVGGVVQPVGKQGTKFNPVEGFSGFRTEGRRPIPAEYKDLLALQQLMGAGTQQTARAAVRSQDSHLAMNALRSLGGNSGFED